MCIKNFLPRYQGVGITNVNKCPNHLKEVDLNHWMNVFVIKYNFNLLSFISRHFSMSEQTVTKDSFRNKSLTLVKDIFQFIRRNLPCKICLWIYCLCFSSQSFSPKQAGWPSWVKCAYWELGVWLLWKFTALDCIEKIKCCLILKAKILLHVQILQWRIQHCVPFFSHKNVQAANLKVISIENYHSFHKIRFSL